MIDAENFLHHDHAAFRRALRIGAIGAKRMFIGGGEIELLTQGNLPLLLDENARAGFSMETFSSSFRDGPKGRARNPGANSVQISLDFRVRALTLAPRNDS